MGASRGVRPPMAARHHHDERRPADSTGPWDRPASGRAGFAPRTRRARRGEPSSREERRKDATLARTRPDGGSIASRKARSLLDRGSSESHRSRASRRRHGSNASVAEDLGRRPGSASASGYVSSRSAASRRSPRRSRPCRACSGSSSRRRGARWRSPRSTSLTPCCQRGRRAGEVRNSQAIERRGRELEARWWRAASFGSTISRVRS